MAPNNDFRLSIVLSTHQTQFEAVAFKGDFEANITKIAEWGYDGVELAIRDPDLVDVDMLEKVLAEHGLKVPAIGTGQECAEDAFIHGVRLAMEPLNRYETDLIHTADELLELIHLIDSPNLGLLLDTFHMNIEEPILEDCILRSGEYIFHFHVADSNRWYPGGG